MYYIMYIIINTFLDMYYIMDITDYLPSLEFFSH